MRTCPRHFQLTLQWLAVVVRAEDWVEPRLAGQARHSAIADTISSLMWGGSSSHHHAV